MLVFERKVLLREYIFHHFPPFSEMDSTTASGMKPTFVAHRILKAVKFKENDIVLAPILHKLVIFIRTCIPSLFFLIMNHRAKSGKKEFSKPKTS